MSNIADMSDDVHTFPAQTFYQKCPILVPEICSSHPYTFCKYWFLPPASPLAALEVLDHRMTETQDCNNIWWSRTDNKMNNSHLFAAVLGTVCSSCENDILRTVVRKMRNSTVSVMDWSLSLFGMLVTVHTPSADPWSAVWQGTECRGLVNNWWGGEMRLERTLTIAHHWNAGESVFITSA